MPPIDYDNYHATLPPEKRPNKEPFRSDVLLSVGAGMSAATASLFGKLAVEERTVAIAATIHTIVVKLDLHVLLDLDKTVWLTRAVFVGGMVATNAIMWALFTKALNRTKSSAQATVLNSCANFCFTALFGYFFFSEPLAMLWWFGAALMVLGGVLVASPTEIAKAKKEVTTADNNNDARSTAVNDPLAARSAGMTTRSRTTSKKTAL